MGLLIIIIQIVFSSIFISESLAGDLRKISEIEMTGIQINIEQFNKRLPQKVDRITTGISAKYDTKLNKITYAYIFDKEVSSHSKQFLSKFKRGLHEQALKDKCEGLSYYFSHGIDVLLNYSFYDGKHFTTILASTDECSKYYQESVTADYKSIQVFTTQQDSGGLSERDFTIDLLNNMEQWASSEVLKNSKKSFLLQGYSEEQFANEFVSSSHYVTKSGKKLGVINIAGFMKGSDEASVKIVRIFGFNNFTLETVGCIRQSSEDIPISFGPCGKKVKEVFKLLD